MAALASADQLPPGGEGAIEATVSTRGRSGAITKVVTVETNDPNNPVSRLQIKGEIVVEAGLDPERINFGQIGTGETVTKAALLKAREPGKVRLTKVELVDASDGLTARLAKVDGVDAVEVTLAGRRSGRVRGQLKVATSSTKQPTIELWVTGEVLGHFDLLPRIVSFPEPGEGEPPQKRVLKVRARGEPAYAVKAARDPAGNIATTLTKAGDFWEVELVLNRVPEDGRGSILIQTTAPDEPTVEASYFVRKTGVRRVPPRALEGAIAPAQPND